VTLIILDATLPRPARAPNLVNAPNVPKDQDIAETCTMLTHTVASPARAPNLVNAPNVPKDQDTAEI